jgi:transposase
VIALVPRCRIERLWLFRLLPQRILIDVVAAATPVQLLVQAYRRLPRLFDRPKYRQRNIIERMFGWLKENRRIVTRFDKLAKI